MPLAPVNVGTHDDPPAWVLAYEVPDRVVQRQASISVRGLLAAASIPVGVSPFVPFTYDVSPLDAISYALSWDIWLGLIAVPFFLGTIVFALRLRLLVRAPASRAEGRTALTLAVASGCGTLAGCAYYCYDVARNGGWDWFAAACWLAVLSTVAAGTWLIVMTRRRLSLDGCAIAAMQTAYLANAVLCLLAYMDYRQIGWWLTAVAAGIIAVEAIVLSSSRGQFATARHE